MIQQLDSNKKPNISIAKAVEMLREAWDDVSDITIKNCWDHVAIFAPERTARLVKSTSVNLGQL